MEKCPECGEPLLTDRYGKYCLNCGYEKEPVDKEKK